jgi:hypothetical protein
MGAAGGGLKMTLTGGPTCQWRVGGERAGGLDGPRGLSGGLGWFGCFVWFFLFFSFLFFSIPFSHFLFKLLLKIL